MGADGLAIEVRRAEPNIRPTGPAAPAEAPAAPDEISVTAKRKTWVKIFKDDPKSRPAFSDYLFPKTGPLTFKGVRIFINTRDPGSLEVKKNGVVVPYESGQPIQ